MRLHAWWMLSIGAVICLAAHQNQLIQAQGADGPTVMAEGKELASGSTYIIPGHSETSSLALFSESVQVVSLYNKTGKDMTINKVEIAVGEGVMTEEFTLLKDQIKREPLTDVSETITDGKNWGFKVRFYPVESGTRTGKVTVTYNTDKTYELNLQGRGRGETKFFSHGETTLHKLFGAANTDEMLSGAVGGPDGSIYFTGQATQIADKFSTDIFWGKVNADGNALFRHPELAKMRDITQEDPLEAKASEHDLNYVSMDGNIACMVNGAGLAMATMDVIKLYGAEPANFLDVGGGTNAAKVTAAFKLILSNPNVKAILVNIFGGIVRCDQIAQGIIDAVKEVGINVPVVVRLEGTNVEKGRDLLNKSGLSIISADNLSDGAKKAVEAVNGANA